MVFFRWTAGIVLLACLGMPQSFALAPGSTIVNRAALTFVVRGATHTVEAADTLVAAADAGNSAPHGLRHDGVAVPENAPGALIGVLHALDVDPGDAFTYATTDTRFVIDGDRLLLAPGTAFDFEQSASVVVAVSVTDAAGASHVESLVIQVADVNEAPFGLQVPVDVIAGDQAGAYIGPVQAEDADAGDQLVYSTSDPRFVVRGGKLFLEASTRLPPGETVELTVTATDRGGLSTSGTFTLRANRVTKPPPTPAQAAFMVLADAGQAVSTLALQPGECAGGLGAGLPQARSGRQFGVPAALNLVASGTYVPGDTVFIRVTDPDQNLDDTRIERLEVIVETPRERETVVLAETAVDSGIFAGYISTLGEASATADCSLLATPGMPLRLVYTDPDDAGDVATADGRMALVLQVWASDRGTTLDGVDVTLVNAITGLVAHDAIRGMAGAAYPAVLRTGAEVRDAAGGAWQPPPGAILLPHLVPGRYRLQVVPPAGYRFPTQRADADLVLRGQGRFRITTGSRGEDFEIVAGDPVIADVPLDPLATDVFLTKEASTDVVETGDRLQYRLRIQSGATASLEGVVLADTLPAGFRYEPGSARLDDRAVEPVIGADGRTLRFGLDDPLAGGVRTLTYVSVVTVGAPRGTARNVAVLSGPGFAGEVAAFADVQVRTSILTDRAFLVGRVKSGCAAEADGVANVRILLEDGTFALSDADGRFHFEDLAAGTHVVQLDPVTVPAGLQSVACRQRSRLDPGGGAQFVDLQRGALGRADFVLGEAPPPVTEWAVRLDSRAAESQVLLRLHIRTGELAASKGSAGIVLPAALAYVPGSARLNSTPLADPAGAAEGALAFTLPALAADAEHRLTFAATRNDGDANARARALVTLVTASGKHRSIAVDNLAMAGVHQAPMLVQMGQVDADGEQAEPGLVRGEMAVMAMPLPVAEPEARTPYQLPAIDNGAAPSFTVDWLRTQDRTPAIIWPPADYNPRIPAVPIIVRHPLALRPVVRVDGRIVDPVAFDGTLTDQAGGLTLSSWKDVPVSERDSNIEVRFLEGDRDTGLVLRRMVHFGQTPVRAELVAQRSYLVADGATPPLLAVRLFDRSGRPARPGLSGTFSLNPPFAPLDKADHAEVVRPGASMRTWQVRQDGIAFIQLEPTTRTGDVVLSLVLAEQKEEKIRARMRPGRQDLVVAGLATSTLGGGPGGDDELDKGRVAFYAKGVMRDDWLVTAAVDTDREFDRSRHVQVDPGQFYPLYGDGSEQRHDAVSQRRFYFKAEKEGFEFEAGDFTTGFERSELARYERTLNGARVAWRGPGVGLVAFGSDSGEAHVQDVLRGDGTSGLYRLKRAPVIGGTETVSLVTRDRLRTERILQRQTLMRYLDYSVDYARGTLLFKQPVQSQDNQFNPVFIEVTYDTEGASGGQDLVTGLRASVFTADQVSEAGVTLLRDDAAGESLELNGIDLHWRLGPSTRVSVEAAQTRSASVQPAHAYIASIDHRGEKFSGQAYFRQQDDGFGVGLSPVTEVDTRKYGVDGEYRASEALLLRAQAFRQQTLRQGGQRDAVGVEARYAAGGTVYRTALQSVRETVPGSDPLASDLLGAGVSRSFFDGRLGLRAESDVNLRRGNGSASYPDRTVVGAEFALDDAVTLLLEQELAQGGFAATRQTRFGVRSRPWTGHSMESWIGQEMTENGPRLFANTGLTQQWQVNPHWLLDAGMDQVRTLKGSAVPQARGDAGAGYPTFNPSAPAIAGSDGTDFTAWFAGATLRRDVWHVSTRLERHRGQALDKWNGLLGVARELEGGVTLSGSAALLQETGTGADRRSSLQARLGAAIRPDGSPWAVFNRLDLNLESNRSNGFHTRNHSLVENIHVNWQRGRHEAGFQGGARYAVGRFDSGTWGGFSVLAGAQYRFDLSDRWDLGTHARVLRSLDAGVSRWNVGVEAGRSFGRQVWVSAGWNFTGFDDDQFAAAEYARQGPYLKFRMRFDQAQVQRYLGFLTADRASAPVPGKRTLAAR